MLELQVQKQLHSTGNDFLLDVDLNIEDQAFVALYGPSGSGKTTLLKILAGLLTPGKGFIKRGEETWFDARKKINLAPQARKTGMVFQQYELFPHLTVKQNLTYILPKKEDTTRVDALLESMQIDGLKNSKPDSLSGGQQQRVALARALIRNPDLLLLDEPFAALDHQTKVSLQRLLQELHQKFKVTTILVSHDPSELYRLTDRIYKMEKGRIQQAEKPDSFFDELNITGKIQIIGEIAEIIPQDVVAILKIVSDNRMYKVAITLKEAETFQPGDQVNVAMKAFNPIVSKIL